MKITRIHIKNFRCHTKLNLNFNDGANIIFGKNGTGKTNILEAIHFATLTKNFLPVSDAECVNFDQDGFEIDAEFITDTGVTKNSRVAFLKEYEKKAFFINGNPIATFSHALGHFPCVVVSPFDIDIVFGSPDHRRKLLDAVISQSNSLYLKDYQQYKRALSQRNKLLYNAKISNLNPSSIYGSSNNKEQLEIWTETLARIGTNIAYERIQFIHDFIPLLLNVYQTFGHIHDEPSLSYQLSFFQENTENNIKEAKDSITKNDIYAQMKKELAKVQHYEVKRGYTLVGPHRDDIDFTLNGKPFKKFASLGQAKTFTTAIKAAQRDFLFIKMNEMPIFLLDDAIEKIDNDRCNALFDYLCTKGQSILTTARKIETQNTVNNVKWEEIDV